jgi:hypothetical protein
MNDNELNNLDNEISNVRFLHHDACNKGHDNAVKKFERQLKELEIKRLKMVAERNSRGQET